jgi:predicted CxxxxCH...CXXCH cytochrome family protein
MRNHTFTIPLCAAVFIALTLVGCKSELNNPNELPKNTSVSIVHGPDFLDTSKAGFHGNLLLQGGDSLGTCRKCHSFGSTQSYAKKTCFDAGCHYAAHGPDMKNPGQPGFHGTLLTSTQEPISKCLDCHSFDAAGGVSGKSCFASGCHKGTHDKDIANPASAKFHAKIIPTIKYDFTGCKDCHGKDYNGGASKKSCNNTGCHVAADGGPEACYTCHGNAATKTIYPQNYPSHGTHLNGGLFSATVVACKDCHKVPAKFDDAGHIGATPGHPPVTITNPVALTVTKGTTGIMSFDAVAGTCKNVYCHGNFTNGNNASPKWTGTDQAKCGSCHGDPVTGNPLPKAPHLAVPTCSSCHIGVIDVNGNFIDKSKHINGILNVYSQQKTDW